MTAEQHVVRRPKRILSMINVDDTILNIGCGDGGLLALINPAYTGEFIGIDTCEKILRAERLYPQHHWVQGELELFIPCLSLREIDWCIVSSLNGIEDWPRVREMLEEKIERLVFVHQHTDIMEMFYYG